MVCMVTLDSSWSGRFDAASLPSLPAPHEAKKQQLKLL